MVKKNTQLRCFINSENIWLQLWHLGQGIIVFFKLFVVDMTVPNFLWVKNQELVIFLCGTNLAYFHDIIIILFNVKTCTHNILKSPQNHVITHTNNYCKVHVCYFTYINYLQYVNEIKPTIYIFASFNQTFPRLCCLKNASCSLQRS